MELETLLDRVIIGLLIYGPPLALVIGAAIGLFDWGGAKGAAHRAER